VGVIIQYCICRRISSKLSNAQEIELLKQQLNSLATLEDVTLYEGEVLHLSQKLDELIVNCYEFKEDI
jgi:hypothetical protein